MNEDKQSIMIEIVSDYKKGNLNMIDAANKISELSKLDINIVNRTVLTVLFPVSMFFTIFELVHSLIKLSCFLKKNINYSKTY